MSDRERWIVYPLLFLTLGIAIRNQFLPTRMFGAMSLRAGEMSSQKIVCKEIVAEQAKFDQVECGQMQMDEALAKHIRVVGLAECVQLKAGETECQAMLIVNQEGKPVVMAVADKNTQAGAIQTMGSNGVPQVQIRATNTGGLVTTIGHNGKILVAMGHEGDNFGVFAQYPQAGPPFPLTSPNRLSPLPKIQQNATPLSTPSQSMQKQDSQPQKKQTDEKKADE
jgi:hypothetical protein